MPLFEALDWKFAGTSNDILHNTIDSASERPDIVVKLPTADRGAFVIETKGPTR